jgi:hypothetical protein
VGAQWRWCSHEQQRWVCVEVGAAPHTAVPLSEAYMHCEDGCVHGVVSSTVVMPSCTITGPVQQASSSAGAQGHGIVRDACW